MATLEQSARTPYSPSTLNIITASFMVAFHILAVVALFAIARNALNRPYSWLVRPRFVFFAWIAADLWLWPEDRKLDRRERDLVVGPVDPCAGEERTAATAVVDELIAAGAGR